MAKAKLARPLTVTLIGTPEQWAATFERMTARAIANPPSKARAKAAVEMHERMDRDPTFKRRVLSRYGHTRLDPWTVLRLAGGGDRIECAQVAHGAERRAPRGRRGGRARSRSPGREADPEPSPRDVVGRADVAAPSGAGEDR